MAGGAGVSEVLERWRVRPQKQAFRHDPDAGVFGDCDRTAWAALLGIERDQLANWATVDPRTETNNDFSRRRLAVLASIGVVPINVAFAGETPLADVLATMAASNAGVPFILGGTSRNGTGHSVVALDGDIVCDPALDESGIVGPMDDGMWWVTFAGHAHALPPREGADA